MNKRLRATIATVIMRVACDDILFGVLNTLAIEAGDATAVTELANRGECPARAALCLVTDLAHAGRPCLAGIKGCNWGFSINGGAHAAVDTHHFERDEASTELFVSKVGESGALSRLPCKLGGVEEHLEHGIVVETRCHHGYKHWSVRCLDGLLCSIDHSEHIVVYI